MANNTTPTTFLGVPQHYKKLMDDKKVNYEQILGIPNSTEAAHFEIVKDDKNKIVYVEFQIEKNEGTELLQTSIKYWEGIYVLDKKIRYDIGRFLKGKLSIKCDYSYGEEKICAYIYEFIYQVNSRIENLTTLGGSK